MRILKKVKNFCFNVARAAKRKVLEFVKDVFNHTEAVILLTAASLGINSVISTMAVPFALPAAIEVAMLMPVVAVVLTLTLVKSAEFRAQRRQPAYALAA